MTAQEIINKVKNLPPISQAALKLVNLLEQASISNDEIVQVIKCDNVLTAKLLRACNSPYFGLDDPVSSVDQAVMLLGHQQILHIVLTLAFGSAMVVPLPGYAVEANELWRHSLITATAAEIVAAEAYDLNVEAPVAFTVGLLHDIGKLVMSQAITPEIQGEIRELIEQQGLLPHRGGTKSPRRRPRRNWRVPAEKLESAGGNSRSRGQSSQSGLPAAPETFRHHACRQLPRAPRRLRAGLGRFCHARGSAGRRAR